MAHPPLTGVRVAPAEISLSGSRARQQLLVTGLRETERGLQEIDLTGEAQFETAAPHVADVTAKGLVVPRGEGRTTITVRVGEFVASAEVTATGFGNADPVDFETEVIAALTKAGCNQGACHGSPQGKNGFRLSLRGFDPDLDFATLARETFARRTNPLAPEESLVLKKGLGQIAHLGGVRFQVEDAAYQTLRSWIHQGCRPSGTSRRAVELQVLPGDRVLTGDRPTQQLVALAKFDDGTVRDVTPLAVFSSSDDETASITGEGVLTFHRTGETTFLVYYLDRVAGVTMTWVQPDPNYRFAGPPARNVVDEHIFAKQAALQLQPAAVASDEVFLRRVYLDVIGTLPAADEARRFLDSSDPQKRAKLIDELLERDEYAYFWALKWADVMRGSDVTVSRRGVHSFHRYLVQVFREDRPFDVFARETLTSLGNTLHQPAANFHRIARTPEDAAEAMAQLFLGVRIQCAKCHNHPFEAITQDDYYGLAACFARVKYKGRQLGLDDEVVYLDRRAELRKPGSSVNQVPAALGTVFADLPPEADRREALVDWMVSPENPYFARATVNRVWYHLFGRGIVEPVDDFRDTNPASAPEVLNELAAQFVRGGYRLKSVLRTILNSAAYQLGGELPETQSPFAALEPEKYFTHQKMMMLSAEQILDAIAAVTGVPTEFPGYPRGTRAIELAEGDIDHPFLQAFAKPVRDVICECARESDPSLSQVIHLLNNPQILENLRSPEGRLSRWLQEGRSDDELLELLYLTALNRRPTPDEARVVGTYLESSVSREEGWRDVAHALINSNEFLLRH